ncbi:primosomal protein [Thiohalobacter thiocyanaticus]|uniref:Primosomal protein n=1 Tax=Thiohalobacter thiocyanaticus TaxID=585455 RepID=A0A1Z4VTB2_9GAMM|nr:hypothetical protein [Thiohalobacter thiocyanaticus]BAZ94642.1 primosomal protein [Thiohalobacter thiocyanaticus]
MLRRLVLLLSLFLLAPAVYAEAEIERIRLGDGIDMDLRRFSAGGDTLLLGFPCDLGLGRAEAQAGEVLSRRGIEVWMADLLGAHFLPIAPSSMRSLEGREVARLIRHAVETTDKRIILIASGYGAVPALRGARIWQAERPEDTRLGGAILFYPMLNASNPQPGQPMDYLPVVHQTRLPIVIMQPTNTPARFWVDKLRQTLAQGGSRVRVELLPGVRGHFYDREDATEAERAMARRLPELVEQALQQLKQMEAP